jgi:hypothetical protein
VLKRVVVDGFRGPEVLTVVDSTLSRVGLFQTKSALTSLR